MPATGAYDEFDYEAVVGKIMIIITPMLRTNVDERLFLLKTEEILKLLRSAWANWEGQLKVNNSKSPPFTRAAILHAKEAFDGGYCLICQHYNTKYKCPIVDKNLPGCVEYTAKIPKKEKKREKTLDLPDLDSDDSDFGFDEV